MTTSAALDLDELRQSMKGDVCVPGDAGYDEAVSIWNGLITKRPAVAARCTGPDDVAAAVLFAQAHDVEISVRGGGHNYAGHALTDGGLTIDLSLMKSVIVDPATKRATCGGGATWADLDGASQEHGLAVPGGFISHTGIAGLTLGGGLGWLSRKAGLSCDNLVGAEVVTADGRILRASASENTDLFWAIRGGGGNFGVVTSFEYQLTDVGPLLQLGIFFFRPEQGAEMLRFAREYVVGLPDECGVFLAGMNAPPEPFIPEAMQLQPVYAIAVVGLGSPEEHAALTAPIRESIEPAFEFVTPIPYVALQQMFNASAPWGTLGYEKAVYLDELTDAAIDVIVEHQPKKASPLSFLPIFVLGGAYSRVPQDEVAFGGSRTTRYVVNIAAAAPPEMPELAEADTAWVRAFWSALVVHANDEGSYVNFMTEPDDAHVHAAYGQKYKRLAAIKATYDPNNVFHLNANIKPGS
jgi:FAD/FMN-containing dehydrogenase